MQLRSPSAAGHGDIRMQQFFLECPDSLGTAVDEAGGIGAFQPNFETLDDDRKQRSLLQDPPLISFMLSKDRLFVRRLPLHLTATGKGCGGGDRQWVVYNVR
ncbi:hypothetical protein DPSP01_001635 [Paraphaeosphaeria sporulosa]